jgi:LPXTG-motif cell wall-anchored protein
MQRRVFVVVVLALCLAAIPGIALAHFPEVQGTEDCSGVVSYTVRSWNGPTAESKTNPDIGVYVDGQLVQHGAFTPENDFSFTGSFQLDAPKTVHVKAVALAPWASGVKPGGSRETTVKAPTDCETTTTTSSPTTTTVAPTTQPPSSSVSPSTTVGGELPFTGSSTVPLLVIGLIMAAGGAAFVVAGKRRGLSG